MLLNVPSFDARKYRARFTWFEWHIEVAGVPGFKNVYIHIGNSKEDTEACILLGDSVNNNQMELGFISSSSQAFKRFYQLIYPKLKAGEEIKLTITDEYFLT